METDFLTQVLDFIKAWGGISFTFKMAGIVALLIGSMKVSFLSPIWNWFGRGKVFVAPTLGFLAGILALGPFSWTKVFAFSLSASGAVILNEILNGLKGFPGFGPMYMTTIEFLSSILGGPPAPPTLTPLDHGIVTDSKKEEVKK